MKGEPINVLLIEDNPGDARLIQELLAEERNTPIALKWVDRLATGLEHLATAHIDGVLLDLSLPDSQGLETLGKVRAHLASAPVVVLTGLADEALGVTAVRQGAQDYLVKGHVDGNVLVRSLRYAIERKRAQEELESAQLQLIQSAKLESVGRLAAGVAHEVKNPLAIIQQGLLHLSHALATTHDNAIALVLQKMDKALKRADRVIRGLLDFSAPGAVEATSTELSTLVDQSLLLVKHELVRAHVSVVKKLGANVPLLKLDRHKIEQVLVNLFMNAIQAMPEGGSLTVKTEAKPLAELGPNLDRRQTDQFRIVVVEVEDTGTGIPEGKLDRVFDPFFTTKSPGQGTGLGLTVTQKIIELHGGMIAIGNRQEGGVRVTLTFKADEGQNREDKRLQKELEERDMPRKKILLIDDEEDFTSLLKLNIEKATEYEALVATNGETGLERIKTCKPDLVLLDIMMPGMGGMETLKRIKSIAPDLPVAMVTAVWKEEEAKQCLEAGAYDYITKPVDFEYLKTALLVMLV